MTSKETRTPIETLPYAEALVRCDAALKPHLGSDIGKGWIINGGVPHETAQGKLMYNLTIQPDRYMNAVEEAEAFHDGGIEEVIEFLTRLDITSIAHFVVRQEEADLIERLRDL